MSSYPGAILILTRFLMVSQVISVYFDKSPMTSAWRHLHTKLARNQAVAVQARHHFCRNPKVDKIVGNIGSTKSNQWDEVSFSDNDIMK